MEIEENINLNQSDNSIQNSHKKTNKKSNWALFKKPKDLSSKLTEKKSQQNETNTSNSTASSNNVSMNSLNSDSTEGLAKPSNFNTHENLIFCLEYRDEIYKNLMLEEKNAKNVVKSNYFDYQSDINFRMRMILVDWLIDIHNQFKFKLKTLFQTVRLIDLYLSKVNVLRTKFQLLGVACLLLSSKENEIYYPSLNEFHAIADNSFSIAELKEMEKDIVKVLNFDILIPTCEEFYSILSNMFKLNEEQYYLGEYFLCCSLVDNSMLKYNPSTIGITCMYIVMKYFNLPEYKDIYSSKKLMGDTNKKAIKNCAKELCFFVKALSKSNLLAAKNKYSSNKFYKVAELCE